MIFKAFCSNVRYSTNLCHSLSEHIDFFFDLLSTPTRDYSQFQSAMAKMMDVARPGPRVSTRMVTVIHMISAARAYNAEWITALDQALTRKTTAAK